ncbi:MAG: hypothetical protein AB1762_20530, partial [Gemmatimonadota bacterium]
LTVLCALAAVAVMLTGEPAEEILEGYPGARESAIEPHEEAARLATIGLGVVGAVSAALLLFVRGRVISGSARALMLVLLLGSSLLFARTATLGGEIRHPEIGGAPARGGETEDIEH